MWIFSKKGRELIKKRKIEEQRYLKDWELLKAELDSKLDAKDVEMKILEREHDELVRKEERLKLTQKRLMQLEKNLELKINLVEEGSDPQQLYIHAMDKALDFAWDVNKRITQDIIDKIRQEDSDKERERYDKAIQNFMEAFNHVEGIADVKTIAKKIKAMEEERIVADRQNRQEDIKYIDDNIKALKAIGIIK